MSSAFSWQVRKSDLSRPRQLLLTLLSRLRYGRVEMLHVRDGEPCFDPAPTLITVVKIGGRNEAHDQATGRDFRLRQQHVELFEALDRHRDCVVRRLEVIDGLPFSLHIEEPVS